MAGITSAGFVPKTLREIREDLVANCQLIQDPETGEYPLFNIGDDTVLSQVIGIFAAELATAWTELGAVYAQFDPQLNTGAGQSGTVQLNAITRKSGEYTIIEVTVGGLAGTLLPKGALVSDMSGSVAYALDYDVYLDGPENATVEATTTATSTTLGAYDPLVGTIITIQTPQSGWFSVTNVRTVRVGQEEENDAELRKRQQRSTALTSYRQVDAIWAALLNIDGVTYARVYQNTSEYPEDDRGIPFKEVAAIVEGGDDEAIADALFYRLPTGQIGYGSTTVERTDQQNILYPISFSRPINVDVFVRMTLYVYDSVEWPSNGVELIQQAIMEYARYNSTDMDIGFPPGTDVIRSRLYTPINSVHGHSVKKLELSLNGEDWSESDISIEWNELAVFSADNIDITVT